MRRARIIGARRRIAHLDFFNDRLSAAHSRPERRPHDAQGNPTIEAGAMGCECLVHPPVGQKNIHSFTVPSALMFDLVPLVNERVDELMADHGTLVTGARLARPWPWCSEEKKETPLNSDIPSPHCASAPTGATP
ncbi:MAG: hypothetical protein ACOH2R_08340 [Pseudomonas sp.]